MRTISTQFITDGKGNKQSVIISMKDYKKILDELEELEDIRMYDEVKSRNEKSIPFDEYLKKRNTKK
ncbi:MAG TPA: hypothetical protein DCQ93_04815 [Bacteroidetes bacterium]|nr:hypothetical protein [Bacteroidota bacterium]